MVAQEAGVRRLVLGHFSNRYTDDTVLLDQAREVFPNTILAHEGLTLDLNQVD